MPIEINIFSIKGWEMETKQEYPLVNALILEHIDWSLKNDNRLVDDTIRDYKYLKRHLARWKWTPPPSEKRKEKNHIPKSRRRQGLINSLHRTEDLACTVINKMREARDRLIPGDIVWGWYAPGGCGCFRRAKMLTSLHSGIHFQMKFLFELSGVIDYEHRGYWFRRGGGMDVNVLPLHLGNLHGFPDPLEGQTLEAVYQFLLFPVDSIAKHINRLRNQLVMSSLQYAIDPDVITYIVLPFLDECEPPLHFFLNE
jgi:hypothetical protein